MKLRTKEKMRDLYDRKNSLYQKWHNHLINTLTRTPQAIQLLRNEEVLTKLPRPIRKLVARVRKIDVVEVTLLTLCWTHCRYLPEVEGEKKINWLFSQ